MEKQVALVVEDTPGLAEGFTAVLELAGFEVKTFRNGYAAQEWLHDESHPIPNLVVLDYHLPYVNGDEILQGIRANIRFVDTKVMMATADARTAEMFRDEADLVLVKPISFSQLEALAHRFAQAGKFTDEGS